MIRKNIFMMLIYYILLIHFLQSLFACVIIESKEGIALYVEIELNKKEKMCIEVPQEYQTREGILEYIKKCAREEVEISDVSFKIKD